MFTILYLPDVQRTFCVLRKWPSFNNTSQPTKENKNKASGSFGILRICFPNYNKHDKSSLSLILNHIVPLNSYCQELMGSVAQLHKGTSSFSADETYHLLNCLHTVCIHHWNFPEHKHFKRRILTIHFNCSSLGSLCSSSLSTNRRGG